MHLPVFLFTAFFGRLINCCPDKDPRCQKCNDQNFCEFCVYSHPNEEGVCQTPTEINEGCYSYSENGVCAECIPGHYKSSEGKCHKLYEKNNENCYMSLISSISCSHCKNSTLTLNGKCTVRRKCSDPNCDVCFLWGTREACFVCVGNYILFGNDYQSAKCIAPPQPITDGCY